MGKISWKKRIILIVVALHFFVGFLSGLPTQYYISKYLTYSPFGPLIKLYEILDLEQRWAMFAPPPKQIVEIKYSAKTSKGWGPMTDLFPNLGEEFGKSFLIVPRGLTRVLVFLRAVYFDLNLDKARLRKFYFHQLSNYFCFGDGKIPSLEAIRFYLDFKTVPYFYPEDTMGNPLPPASSNDRIIGIYERTCTQ